MFNRNERNKNIFFQHIHYYFYPTINFADKQSFLFIFYKPVINSLQKFIHIMPPLLNTLAYFYFFVKSIFLREFLGKMAHNRSVYVAGAVALLALAKPLFGPPNRRKQPKRYTQRYNRRFFC